MRKAFAAGALALGIAAGSLAFVFSRGDGGPTRPAARAGPAAPASVARAPVAPARSAPHLDFRTTAGGNAAFLRRFDLSAIYRSTSPDSIRAIDDPIFETPEEAEGLLSPSSLVIGLARGGDVKAYPVDLLSLHEVVNDVVGGEPVAVTWCPLCYSALAFERRIDGRVYTFGVSGYLYRANQILFDRETGSLWSQLLGGGVTGVNRGRALRPVPLVMETWETWLKAHPDTVVLSIARDSRASDFTRPRSTVTSRGIEESDQPYGAYATKVSTYYPRVVRGIVDGSRVLGVFLDGRAKAYALATLQRRRAIDDLVARRPILVSFDAGADSGSVFSRRVRGQVLSFRRAGDQLVDRETGSRWSATTGQALAGPLAGAQLPQLPSTFSYWFAWRAFHPATAIGR